MSYMTLIYPDGPKPAGMSGRDWRRMQSSMRRRGSKYRIWWADAWQWQRERGDFSDRFPDRQHFVDIARRAAVRCHAAREAT